MTEAVPMGAVRAFPLWLLQAAVEGRVHSRAVILWTEIASLVRHGTLGVCNASCKYLASRLPKDDGATPSERTVRRLLEQLVQVGALDIVEQPGKPSEYVPHLEPVARNLDLFAAASAGARRASDPRPMSSPAAATPACTTGHPGAQDGVPRRARPDTPAPLKPWITPEETQSQRAAELSTGGNRDSKQSMKQEKQAPPPPAPVAVVEIEVQRIFVAYQHAIRDLGPRIEELRKTSGDRRPPPGILRPVDRAMAAEAAAIGTCRTFDNDALREEFRRTAEGLLRAKRPDGGVGYDPSLRAVLNHMAELWAESAMRPYPGGDEAAVRLAELAEIAGVSVDEFRAMHGGAR